MKKVILTTVFLLSLANVQAQEFFSDKRPVQSANEFTRKVNDISYDIDLIIKTNKDKLKEDLNEIEKKVENNELTKVEADKLRNEKAEFYAKQIEEETQAQEEKIKMLINNKIEDNINFSSDMTAYQKQLVEKKVLLFEDIYFGSSNVFADGKLNNNYYKSSVVNSFGVSLGVKTRVGKETSRWFWKSGIDLHIHSTAVKDNKTIENVNGKTELVDIPFKVDKTRLSFPEVKLANYLEYDFSKRKKDDFGNAIIKSRQSFYVGLGGYVGIATKISKNFVYKKDGETYRENVDSRFNAEKFIYGIGGYVGYKGLSIKASYNLNHVFKKSFADQNMFNVSLVLSVL